MVYIFWGFIFPFEEKQQQQHSHLTKTQKNISSTCKTTI